MPHRTRTLHRPAFHLPTFRYIGKGYALQDLATVALLILAVGALVLQLTSAAGGGAGSPLGDMAAARVGWPAA
jgi:hypothetical protein